ncbi:hypothetical protein [uncultured Desulfuromonas sp.]|uniref:hypothetical protein n=1 Tax=uncultured Desulfuromonas sp. TaxID=181013 RepID=UPI002AAAE9C8|nr:hypothetical protein [uncultured Desulfuromonas sp.]
MYILKKFSDNRFDRINAIIDSLSGHISGYVNLIGSAALPFPEVCAVQACPATACRVEGLLGNRIFPGTQPVDDAESFCEELVLSYFGITCDGYAVNVQPHSATQCNQATLIGLLRPGDLCLALGVREGGHISHKLGLPSECSYMPIPMTSSGINYEELAEKTKSLKPRMLIAGSTSFPRFIDYQQLRKIADSVNAFVHADIAHTAPLISAGVHPNAFPYADTVTVDTSKSLRGPKGGVLLFRKELAAKVTSALFPKVQTSPDPTKILAKTCCFSSWQNAEIYSYANRLVHTAKIMSEALSGFDFKLAYGGTDTHLILIDLTKEKISGKEAEARCEKERILVNRNQTPDDRRDPWEASGLELEQ